MKKILMSFAIIAAIGGAAATHATAKSPLFTRYSMGWPGFPEVTCIDIYCDENPGSLCTVPGNYGTYRSINFEVDCNTPVVLYQHP